MTASRHADSSRTRPVLTSFRRGRWVPSVFSAVPEGSLRRQPSDIVRFATALAGVVLTAWAAAEERGFERDVYDFLTDLPAAVQWLCESLFWLMAASEATIFLAAIATRRLRLVLSMTGAGAGALLASVGLRSAVDGIGPGYPAVSVAVATCALLAAAPYLTRPTRRVVESLILLGAFGSTGFASEAPVAVVGALALGWGVASMVRFVARSPAGTPSVAAVDESLRELGLDVESIELDPAQIWGESRFFSVDDEGRRLRVTVIGRDATDARLFAKLWRFVLYKDSGPFPQLTRRQQVDHLAYTLLLAERSGARVPDLVAAGVAGHRADALLVSCEPVGTPLTGVAPDRITDSVLDDAWRNLLRLHEANMAHGSVVLENVALLDDGTTALLDFSLASTSASVQQLGVDRARLLAGTAALVGAPRALGAAMRALGRGDLMAILPLLRSRVIGDTARSELDEPKTLLDDLRSQAADLTDTDVPDAAELRRVSPATLLMAAGAILGVYLLFGELADVPADVFSGAEWGYVALAFVLSQMPQFTSAVAILGSVAEPLPFRPVVGVQFANNFTGLVGGTVANTALVVRFFQQQGRPIAVAASSGVLNSLAGLTMQILLVVTGLIFTASDFQFSSTGGGGLSGVVVVGTIAAGVGAGAVVLVPRLRRAIGHRLGPQVAAARNNLAGVARQPSKAAMLFGGNLASQVLFALALGTALEAYGGSLPLVELIVINSFASFLGGAAPVPGGMGVVEAGLIAGLTAAGVPEGAAIAATFTSRMFTSYLPPIWGWFSLQWLRRHDYV